MALHAIDAPRPFNRLRGQASKAAERTGWVFFQRIPLI